MKTGIHPKTVLATVTCACGNSWQTMSTREALKTDLCSKCHPFFTGEQRIVDTAGQVERFMRRMSNATQAGGQPTSLQRRGSKNRANVPPPPQERRPAPERAAEGESEPAETEMAEALGE